MRGQTQKWTKGISGMIVGAFAAGAAAGANVIGVALAACSAAGPDSKDATGSAVVPRIPASIESSH